MASMGDALAPSDLFCFRLDTQDLRRRKEAPSSEEGMWNKGLSSVKAHQLVPGHSSLLCLAYFLQAHWDFRARRCGVCWLAWEDG